MWALPNWLTCQLLTTLCHRLAEDARCGILQCSYAHEDSRPSSEKVKPFLQRIEHTKSKYPGTVDFLQQASSGLGLSAQEDVILGDGAIGRNKQHARKSKKSYSVNQDVKEKF